jgi:Na+/melibiose symporter-like transporter
MAIRRAAAADSRAIIAFVGFEFLWNLGCGMFSLSVISALVVAMDGSLAVAGLIPALSGIASLAAQPLAMLLFGRARDRRRASVGLLHGMTLCFLALGALIFILPADALSTQGVPATVALSVAGLLFGSLNAPLYYSLAIDAVSPPSLGRLTGLRQAGNAAGNLAAAGLVAWLLASTDQPFNYGRVLVAGGLLGLAGSSSLLLMPEPYHSLTDGEPARSSFHHLALTLRALWRQRPFWTLMGGLWLAAFVSGATGIGVAHLRQSSGSDGVVGAVLVASSLARLLAGPPCGGLVTRRGMRSAAFVSLGASCAGFAALAALPVAPAAVVWGAALGVALATMEMWSFMLPARMFPIVNRVGLVAVVGTLTGPVTFAAPLLMGRLLDAGLAPAGVFLPAAGLALAVAAYFRLWLPAGRAAPQPPAESASG